MSIIKGQFFEYLSGWAPFSLQIVERLALPDEDPLE